MPFIPPVSISGSLSGLSVKERLISNTSTTFTRIQKGTTLTKVAREDKDGSVKERMALNLKQLGKKSQPSGHLPIAKAVSVAELHAKRKERILPSSQTDSFPASSSGEFLFKKQQHKHVSQSSLRSEPEVKTRPRHQEKVGLTLTLTPDAVLLLHRRNSERRQQSTCRNAGSGGGVHGSTFDTRCRRENITKRHQAASEKHSTSNSRVGAKNYNDAHLVDLSSIVKNLSSKRAT
ncbi:hypothetical protein CesoFtcFv8_008745 [Champsocephalus esox]|uniref:Uncharacterized protein n=1 Tax=Champsocephalus esox TaxID=159716 RepID=A0AAN8C930_9TELE|nr:hypothetical protein CesoFtcFv8_008745 [Champsocephalus esox]